MDYFAVLIHAAFLHLKQSALCSFESSLRQTLTTGTTCQPTGISNLISFILWQRLMFRNYYTSCTTSPCSLYLDLLQSRHPAARAPSITDACLPGFWEIIKKWQIHCLIFWNVINDETQVSLKYERMCKPFQALIGCIIGCFELALSTTWLVVTVFRDI
jgi:hypothetical protein